MQADTWDIIIQAVSLLASMASLALAIVAIWLSFKFYTMSVHSTEKIEEANRAISASVDRLEKVFQMQYSDTFSMVRDTYSDFRKRLLTDTTSASQAEQLVESKADEKIEQLRTEIQSELSNVVNRIGQTDSQISSVQQQISQVVDKAIVRSREVDKEAREETLKERLLSYLSIRPSKQWEVDEVVTYFRNEFKLTDILKALFEISQDGTINFDTAISTWGDLFPNTTFKKVR
ncbi:MAG TPA: hypothetical protein VEY11_16645 [Pyrinomonadaceae bacterium]|nr:hypothetical protein [Pyrinomonadaceae bacterium]